VLAVVAVLQKAARRFSGFENKCDELRDKSRNVGFKFSWLDEQGPVVAKVL
jgi:hypothetical protein